MDREHLEALIWRALREHPEPDHVALVDIILAGADAYAGTQVVAVSEMFRKDLGNIREILS